MSCTPTQPSPAWAWADTSNWVRWLAPVFIDGAIVTYTLSLAIVRWRGEPVRRTLTFLGTFTGISVLVNFAHAGAARDWDFSQMETWFSALIGIAGPLAALFAADEATRLVFTRTATEPTATSAPLAAEADEPELPSNSFPEPTEPTVATEPTITGDFPATGREFRLGFDGQLELAAG